MQNKFAYWRQGVTDGIPICLGYFSVAFTFGIMAKQAGLTPLEAVLMSATNLTSAGQFASLGLISSGAAYIELAITQFVINLRYCLMSCSLAQKLAVKTPFVHRFFIAYGVTDEIFGVSVCKSGYLHPFYSYGLMTVAVPGWTLGTLAGIVSGGVLPERVVSALSVALYGMFIAVIVPPAKKSWILAGVILVSMALSGVLAEASLFNQLTAGFRLIVLTVVIAGVAAYLFPLKEETQ